ncbi:MAG: hypothetical protein O8C66_09965 [Candidatus Methanoperedens sp.]|nr:hypothetical protein [Candidatus Methanoperedens sp.]MCZ7370821.1 hypothetical protein [Candidatus Methanoperedens sp.]
MPDLFLIPIINIFDVHDVAIRDWLNKLDVYDLKPHLEYPFRLDRFFPESTKHALKCVDDVHGEILRLLDITDPQAVFFDISVDFVDLENRYNKRLISPLEFWSEYYQISAGKGGSQALYCIYIKGIIDRNIRLIEGKDHLPLSVVFYGQDIKTREEFIPVYENILEKDDDFLLQMVRVVNEIATFRTLPKHLWYTPMQIRLMAISYEETEKFYNELLNRLGEMLRFKIRDYIVRNLKDRALELSLAYERFLEHKIRADEIKFSNILEGLNILTTQLENPSIVIFCAPMHYCALLDALKKEKSLGELAITIREIDISSLLDKMKPFTQKNRIMQNDYDVALNILGYKKPAKYDTPGAILNPAPGIPHLA